MSDIGLFVVTGLKSERGKILNGSVGRAVVPSAGYAPDRVPVLLDGEVELISLKYDNLKHIDYDKYENCEVGAGRPHFRVEKLSGLVINKKTQEIHRHLFEEPEQFGRAKINLLIITIAICQFAQDGRRNRRVLFTPTDMNVARALQLAFSTSRDIHLGPSMDSLFRLAVQGIRKLREKSTNLELVFHFVSVRVIPDNMDETSGEQRVKAVMNGCYKIYPCPHEDYFDAHEVRYPCEEYGSLTIKQEMYLDYGEQEAIDYVQNAVALGEAGRLTPMCLAKRDPQAFWSAVLHLDKFLETCRRECGEEADALMKDWECISEGSKQSKKFWEHTIIDGGLSRRRLSPEVQGTDWGIGDSEAKHKKLSKEYAICALYSVMNGVAEKYKGAPRSFVVVMDHYKDTDLGQFIYAVVGVKEKTEKHKAKARAAGEEPSSQILDGIWNDVFAAGGFGPDVMDTSSDPKASCGNCGCTDLKKLRECDRCNGAVYCSSQCQKSKWKEHKKVCSPVFAEVNRLMRMQTINFGIDMKFELYKPGVLESSTETIVTSETTSIGSMGIIAIPGGKSFLNFNDGAPSMSQLMKPATILEFQTLEDLPILERFLVSCGPLADIRVAQKSLEGALRVVGGNLENLRIRACGFTALEWAAKKGNKDIVEWLCNDPRTRALVRIGSPVGWACYTGQVEIAKILVDHGANPTATHPVLWSQLHPLFVAAQNGQLESIKWLVEDMGQDISMTDSDGQGILSHIKLSPNWKDLDGHKSCHAWVKTKLKVQTK
jgi:Ankyrin repeats (3 copies)/MYND finger